MSVWMNEEYLCPDCHKNHGAEVGGLCLTCKMKDPKVLAFLIEEEKVCPEHLAVVTTNALYERRCSIEGCSYELPPKPVALVESELLPNRKED